MSNDVVPKYANLTQAKISLILLLVSYMFHIFVTFLQITKIWNIIFIMKNITSNIKKVLGLAREQGIFRSSDLAQLQIPRVTVTRLVASGRLERIGRGLYCLPQTGFSEKESLAVIAIRVPQAVFCLFTALELHHLTTQLPRQVWIAMPEKSHVPRIDYPTLRMVQYSGKSYSEGIETIQTAEAVLRVYNPAKTVADCFKHRNKIGIDIAIEALKEAYTKKKASMDALWYYAKICRVANIMRPYLESIE